MKKNLLSVAFFSMVLLLSACGSNRVKLADSDLSDEAVASESAPSETGGETSALSEDTAAAVEEMTAAGEPAEEMSAEQVAELDEAPQGEEVATQGNSEASEEVSEEVAQNDATSGITMEPALAAPQLMAQAEVPAMNTQATEAVAKPKRQRKVSSTPKVTEEVKSEPITSAPVESTTQEPTAKTEEAPKVEVEVAANNAPKTDEVDHFAPAPAANPVEQPEVQTASAGIEGILERHPFAIALILVGAVGFIFVITRMRRGMEV